MTISKAPIFTWQELSHVTDTTAPPHFSQTQDGVFNVVDDSRQVNTGDLFIAIKGQLTDGHQHIAKAIDKGAGALCISSPLSTPLKHRCNAQNIPCFLVNDTMHTYHQLANAYRRKQTQLTVIAITGSNGKTSSRTILGTILEKQYPGQVLQTQGNTNNFFGVPRNLFRLKSHHRFAVIELGTSLPGEIPRLANTVEPDIAMLTNVGPAHLEAFGSINAIFHEKTALFQGLHDHGLAVFPQSLNQKGEITKRLSPTHSRISFGNNAETSADITATNTPLCTSGTQYQLLVHADKLLSISPLAVTWPLGGEHNAQNATAALAVALHLNTPVSTVTAALETVHLPGMRMAINDLNGTIWINDAYNANPASMLASLTWLKECLERNRFKHPALLILGDMCELGPQARKEHQRIITWCLDNFPQAERLLIGPLMQQCTIENRITGFTDISSASKHLTRQTLAKYRTIYLKGSRSIALETLIPTPRPQTKH